MCVGYVYSDVCVYTSACACPVVGTVWVSLFICVNKCAHECSRVPTFLHISVCICMYILYASVCVCVCASVTPSPYAHPSLPVCVCVCDRVCLACVRVFCCD